MTAGPVLETERLILRPPVAEDFDGWAAFQADPDATHFVGGVEPRAAAWRSFCAQAGAWQIKGFAMFSMIERASNRWIGRTGPWMPEGWPGTEVGWGVLPAFEGKGYAYEAAVASIDFVFNALGWAEVIHTINPDNLPSIRLAERLGSTNLGPTQLPEPYQDFRVDKYGQSADQWRARRREADVAR